MAWNDLRITTVIQAIPFEKIKIEILHSWFATSLFLSAGPTLSLSTLYSGTTDALNMISCENESLTTKVFQEESKRNLPLRGSPRKRNNGEKNMEGSGVPSVPPQHCHLRKINSLNFMDLFANPKNKN